MSAGPWCTRCQERLVLSRVDIRGISAAVLQCGNRACGNIRATRLFGTTAGIDGGDPWPAARCNRCHFRLGLTVVGPDEPGANDSRATVLYCPGCNNIISTRFWSKTDEEQKETEKMQENDIRKEARIG